MRRRVITQAGAPRASGGFSRRGVDRPAACPTDSCVTAQRSWPSGVHRRRDEHRRYQRFLTTVGEQTGLDRDDSEGAAMATLATLAERISKARADELAEDLPERPPGFFSPPGTKREGA